MEKTTRRTSIFAKKYQVDKGGLNLEDHISGLPDEVLISILSLLTMKEAGRTSLLSKRWRYMWTYITALNFDASHIMNELQREVKQLEVERPLYLSWVNQVLKSHNSPSIDEFRVQFDVDETCKFDIDNWVNFALEKRVKRLELDLSESWRMSEGYNFPGTDRITNHLHSLSLGFTSCNSLTNLLLAHVNITGQVLEYFLTNCPLLEQLSVHKSICLVNLKVPNQSLKLKRLEITHCFKVESIEIFAMNLISFMYVGPKINLPFKNVQEPVELSIGGGYCEHLIYNFLGISSNLSQLESLTLYMNSIKNSISFAQFPVFNKLKQLELIISARDDESLIVFAPLIEACPFLYKFVLQSNYEDPILRRKRRRVTSRPHQYLKVVELIGFVGRTIDVEFAMYLIKSALMLEKIAFDPREPYLIGTPWEFEETKKIAAARKRAEYLGTKLSAGTTLVII